MYGDRDRERDRDRDRDCNRNCDCDVKFWCISIEKEKTTGWCWSMFQREHVTANDRKNISES